MANSLLLTDSPAGSVTVTNLGAVVTLADAAAPGTVTITDLGAAITLEDQP